MPEQVHIGDVGTELLVHLVDQDGLNVDVSSAALRQMFLRKPDGTVLTKTATPGSFSDPLKTSTLGYMHYLSVAADFDFIGAWRVQGYVEIGSGKWHSDERTFRVYRNLG